MAEERRKYKRVKAKFDVLVALENEDMEMEYRTFSSKAVDISSNGILITTSEPLKEGSLLNLTFFPPKSNKMVDIEGRVVRVTKKRKKYAIGIKFGKFGKGMKRRLNSIFKG